MKTPDEEVAEAIIDQLKKQKLLSDAGVEKLYPKLIKGTATSEDWKLLFETDRLGNEKDK